MDVNLHLRACSSRGSDRRRRQGPTVLGSEEGPILIRITHGYYWISDTTYNSTKETRCSRISKVGEHGIGDKRENTTQQVSACSSQHVAFDPGVLY